MTGKYLPDIPYIWREIKKKVGKKPEQKNKEKKKPTEKAGGV